MTESPSDFYYNLLSYANNLGSAKVGPCRLKSMLEVMSYEPSLLSNEDTFLNYLKTCLTFNGFTSDQISQIKFWMNKNYIYLISYMQYIDNMRKQKQAL